MKIKSSQVCKLCYLFTAIKVVVKVCSEECITCEGVEECCHQNFLLVLFSKPSKTGYSVEIFFEFFVLCFFFFVNVSDFEVEAVCSLSGF